TISANRCVNLAGSSGSPITPVEARKTSPSPQAAALLAALLVAEVVSRPFLPVNALAFPELTTSIRALPPVRLARHISTGAEGQSERVNTPATLVPSSKTMARRSVRPLYLMPAWAVAIRTPSIGGILGCFLGASGEIASEM